MDERKKLMVEVLPNPRTENGRATPRERARRRLVQLTNVAATAGIGLSVSYCVVDMMPSPAQCADSGLDPDPTLDVTAIWKDVDEQTGVGTLELEVVSADGYTVDVGVAADSGEVTSGPHPWEIFVLAGRDHLDVTVALYGTCNESETVTLRFDVATRKDGASVPYVVK